MLRRSQNIPPLRSLKRRVPFNALSRRMATINGGILHETTGIHSRIPGDTALSPSWADLRTDCHGQSLFTVSLACFRRPSELCHLRGLVRTFVSGASNDGEGTPTGDYKTAEDIQSARKLVQELEGGISEDGSLPKDLRKARLDLFDACICHCEILLQQARSVSADRPRSVVAEVNNPQGGRENTSAETLVEDIFLAIDEAHRTLEQIDPSLGIRGFPRLAPQAESSPLNIVDGPESNDVLPLKEDPELSRRCDTVLKAWASVVRLGFDYLVVSSIGDGEEASRNKAALRALKSKIKRRLRGVPQRAQFLLDRMELSHVKDYVDYNGSFASGAPRTIVWPSVESYNRVVEAWAFSDEHLRGPMAEGVFQRLKSSCNTKTVPFLRLNGDSYRQIIWAWSLSRDRRAAFTATGHLMKMLRKLEKGDEDMEPRLEDYRVLLDAWTRAEDPTAPEKANSVLRLMEYAYGQGLTEVQADLACFRSILLTAGKRPTSDNLGSIVDDILAKMDERFIAPDAVCYGAAIRTWKNNALVEGLPSGSRDRSVRRTLELLDEMKDARYKLGDEEVAVSTSNVNDAIEVLAVSSDPEKYEVAETLLYSLEQQLVEGNVESSLDPSPDADSYRLTIQVLAATRSDDKIDRGLVLLQRMKDHYEKGVLARSSKPQVVAVFTSAVKLCGHARVRSREEGLEVFRKALACVDGMRELVGLRPDATCYAALLEACRCLLPVGPDRQQILEHVFRLCCEDGMVDDNVLQQLLKASTDELYARLVIVHSTIVEDVKMVPEHWTRNALGRKVISADGRKTIPLGIDGRLTVTRAMREFQNRRIADKRNQKLLRGGRLRRPGSIVG